MIYAKDAKNAEDAKKKVFEIKIVFVVFNHMITNNNPFLPFASFAILAYLA